MPKMHVSASEAAALRRKRTRDKAWNTSITAAITKVKARLKGADPIQTAVLQQVVGDLRSLIR